MRAKWRTSRRSFTAALLAAACASATGADSDPVKAPYVEVGDCWSFHATHVDNHGAVDDYEECITFVDRRKNLILAVAKLKADGREIDTSYATDWSPRTAISGLITSPVGGQEPAHFPLRVGDTYTEEHEIRRALLGAVAGKSSVKFKVVGWEDVAVPAGIFHALKIVGDGTTTRYDIGRTIATRTEYWYAPGVERAVKKQFHSPRLDYGFELTGYRLNR